MIEFESHHLSQSGFQRRQPLVVWEGSGGNRNPPRRSLHTFLRQKVCAPRHEREEFTTETTPSLAYLHQHADVFIWFWRGQDALNRQALKTALCAHTKRFLVLSEVKWKENQPSYKRSSSVIYFPCLSLHISFPMLYLTYPILKHIFQPACSLFLLPLFRRAEQSGVSPYPSETIFWGRLCFSLKVYDNIDRPKA